MSKVKIKDWGPENDFRYGNGINKHHTARLKKVLTTIFPKNEGWDFSVSKRYSCSINVNIMKMPFSLEESLNAEKLKREYLYSGILNDFNGVIEIIKDVISFSVAPQKTISEDYGNIPNYYKNVIFGKWNKPLKIVDTGKKLTKKEYENRLNMIKNEIKNLIAIEDVMENL